MSTFAIFQTKARAIDHLGRGQIADTPTAVSELWKNAYDAYARNVALHIFDGSVPLASIYDDGCGMTVSELRDKWFVVGTESKIGKKFLSEETFGLAPRVRLGEKGIGRLSVAFLSPVTLVVTKKMDAPYAALLVDWRFFENPFLLISDIRFPLIEFSGLEEIPKLISNMTNDLKSNFTDTNQRVNNAWKDFSELELQQNKNTTTTKQKILSFTSTLELTWDHFLPWWRFLRNLPEKDKHGTALFCLNCNADLSGWVQGNSEDPDIKIIQNNMRETLINFVDPYSLRKINFSYELVIHRELQETVAVSSQDAFTLEEMRELEHCIEGSFDERGVFSGTVKVFGVSRGSIIINPKEIIATSGREYVGPFTFRLATIEFDKRNTTHSDEQFAVIQGKLAKYGGINLYRDGMRVLPYGRADGDLFLVEERRSKNAGREFFSYRRCCGGIFISSIANPNLKDKAGREGLVSNKARRTFERLVINLLMVLSRKFFGSSSDIRKEELPEIQKQRQQKLQEAEKAQKKIQLSYTQNFRRVSSLVNKAKDQALQLQTEVAVAGKAKAKELLLRLREKIDKLYDLKNKLRLPARPSKSGISDDEYRSYRNVYKEFCITLSAIKRDMAFFEASGLLGTPRDMLLKKLQSNESKLSYFISKELNYIKLITSKIIDYWEKEGERDRKIYRINTVPLLNIFDKNGNFDSINNELDLIYEKLYSDIQNKYSSIIGSLDQIKENIKLEDAFSAVYELNEQLEEKIDMLHSVAQLGITVEIIGHELETLENQVRRNFDLMPKEVHKLRTFKEAKAAHDALIDRLRFLSPLKKSSYQKKLKIYGNDIENYILQFFGNIFIKEQINFSATDSFRNMVITDVPSRIYPTFINLVNNSLYWVRQKEKRIILLDFQYEKIIVADSGPGVDEDDIDHLFQMFFTRRVNGRGIGLYLCRENLSLAGFIIRYANNNDPHILEGANFIIEKKGKIK